MGCGSSFAKTPFDYPEPGPTIKGSLKAQLISRSHLYCLVQHNAEWPEYYCLVDCRPLSAYTKAHVVGAKHVTELGSVEDSVNGVTVIAYDVKDSSSGITTFFDTISKKSCTPNAVYVLQGSFSAFKSRYKVVMSNFSKTEGEQPGPVELVPATRKNPAIYAIHRNQFQHCKTTIAYLGCSTVVNISSRRLFLKTAAIKLENIQFDSVNEPYDEAIASLAKYANEKPKTASKGNILLIDETGFDYGGLLVGWFWFQNGYDLEQICEHLSNKMGELDPWYLDVLRAWAEAPSE